MPELQWDEFDFFYCLEVEPQVEEYGVSYAYEVRRDDFVLYLTVRPLESVIEVSLYQVGSEFPLLDCALFVHGKVRRVSDKRGEYLEITNCLMAPRSAYLEAETIWDVMQPDWTVKLAIKPHFQIRYVD